MVIEGTSIAQAIYSELTERIAVLKSRGINLKLAVLFVGDDQSSKAYIAQKEQNAKNLGIEIEVITFPKETITNTLLDRVRALNANPEVTGIIVQRPLPAQINQDVIQEEIDDNKDVDGFKPGSPYQVPLVMAVVRILNNILIFEKGESQVGDPVTAWLKTKKIVLVGKGSTAGKPLIDYMREKGIAYELIDSSTPKPEEILREADIVISSVGKPHTINSHMLKQGVILISVGLSKDTDGKTKGDYDEDEIKDIASYYTKTPGGVGPVNVAMLFYNLVIAAEQ